MKYIIVLTALANSGKTCVLKRFWDIFPGKTVADFNPKAIYNKVGIKETGNTKEGVITVGDVSDGDTPDTIQTNLALMVKNNCDIIICAAHSIQQFKRAIKNLGNTIMNERLEKAGVTREDLEKIPSIIKKEYTIISWSHFSNQSIPAIPISKSHKLFNEIEDINITYLSAQNLLTLVELLIPSIQKNKK